MFSCDVGKEKKTSLTPLYVAAAVNEESSALSKLGRSLIKTMLFTAFFLVEVKVS